MKKSWIYIGQVLLLLSLISCAKTNEEATKSAIREARYLLTSLKCSDAQEVLDDVGEDKDNASYVAVYASAIACKAGYTDLGTAIDNLANINTAGTSNLIPSFAAFNSSNETAADQTTYTYLIDAIRYIIEADASTPSTTGRLTKYGIKAGNDLSMQALYLITVAFGKWMAFYGNADVAGVKGAGSVDDNTCLYSYTQADAVSYINGPGAGACTNASGVEGSDALKSPVTAAEIKTRMCEAIILFNNMFDILSGIDLSTNTSLGNVGDAQALMTTIYSSAIALESSYNAGANGRDAVSTLQNITSLATCESATIHFDQVEKFHAILFETVF